jgi:hypothetical protein
MISGKRFSGERSDEGLAQVAEPRKTCLPFSIGSWKRLSSRLEIRLAI